VTSLEYALMAAIISTATVTTVVSVGQRLDDTFRYTLAAFGDNGNAARPLGFAIFSLV
jgi:Flp pilus assembly pilin Flp